MNTALQSQRSEQQDRGVGGDVTSSLAGFASDLTFAAVPLPVLEHTKLAILDTLGVALAGSGMGEGCEGVLAYATACSDGGAARIWASGQRMSPGLAAFCNACHARSLDYDDIIENPQVHVAVCVVPAAFAALEFLKRPVDGKNLLTAVAAGSEIQSRLAAAIALTQDSSSFPVMLSTQVFGYFAAAAAVGNLLGLHPARMSSAFGLAMMQATGTEEMVVHSPDSVGKCIYAGFSNQGGLQSALMAASNVLARGAAIDGQAGLFNAFYRGRYTPGVLSSALGQRYFSLDRCFKASPGTLVSHAFAEAALIILQQHRLSVADISEVRLHVGGWGKAMCEPIEIRRHPPTAAAAMNSIPFIVGKAILNGKVSLMDFQKESRENPAVRAMTARIHYRHDASLNNPAGLEPGVLEVVTSDGRVIKQRVDKPRGHPSRQLSFDEIARKFAENCSFAATPLQPDRVRQIVDYVQRLEQSSDVRELLDLIVPSDADRRTQG